MIAATAICAIHYTIIGAAISFVIVPGKTFTSPYLTFMTFSQNDVFYGAIVASLLYSCIVLFIALADARSWFYRLSKSSRVIDEKIMNIAAQIDALNLNGDSYENAAVFIDEFKSFITEYKVFKGGEEILDAKRPSLAKPLSIKHNDLFDVTGHMKYFHLGEKRSFDGSKALKIVQDNSSKLFRQESKQSNFSAGGTCENL
jgi:hypothetical protein